MRGAPTSFPSSLRTPSMELPGGSGVTLLRMKKDHGIQPAKKKGPNQRPNRTRLENQGQQKGKTCERMNRPGAQTCRWGNPAQRLTSSKIRWMSIPGRSLPQFSQAILPNPSCFLEDQKEPPLRFSPLRPVLHRSGFPGHHRQTFSDRAARSAWAVSEPARGLPRRCRSEAPMFAVRVPRATNVCSLDLMIEGRFLGDKSLSRRLTKELFG